METCCSWRDVGEELVDGEEMVDEEDDMDELVEERQRGHSIGVE